MSSMPKGSRRWFLRLSGTAGAALAGSAVDAVATGTAGEWPEPAKVAQAVRLAIGNTIAEGVDPLFPAPFELAAIAHDTLLRDDVAQRVTAALLDRSAACEADDAIHAMEMPKQSYGHRPCAHLELMDSLRYLALAILVAEKLERARIPAAAQKVFSWRFAPSGGQLFDDAHGYPSFRDRILEKLDPAERCVLVSADIADFYPSIDQTRLLETLRRIGVEHWLLATLDDLFARWRPVWERGLLVGGHGSRILAEAALLEVDRGLEAGGIDFIRYVDDYRMFAPDAATARRWLTQLRALLKREGLALNRGKTSLMAVTLPEFEVLIEKRRLQKWWGQDGVTAGRRKLAQMQQPEISGAPPENTEAEDDKEDKPLPRPPRPPANYIARPPRRPPPKPEDKVLLQTVDRAALLRRVRERATRGRHVPLADFRLLVESGVARGEPDSIGEVFEFLAQCAHCIPYLSVVLIEEQAVLSAALRAIAREWFAGRMTRGECTRHFETLCVAQVLTTEGFSEVDALAGYLRAAGAGASPIVLRVLLSSLRGGRGEALAAELIAACKPGSLFTLRAVLDVAWPQLAPAQRAAVMSEFREPIRRDPFLAAITARS